MSICKLMHIPSGIFLEVLLLDGMAGLFLVFKDLPYCFL
jgi:hypothetical protein